MRKNLWPPIITDIIEIKADKSDHVSAESFLNSNKYLEFTVRNIFLGFIFYIFLEIF